MQKVMNFHLGIFQCEYIELDYKAGREQKLWKEQFIKQLYLNLSSEVEIVQTHQSFQKIHNLEINEKTLLSSLFFS